VAAFPFHYYKAVRDEYIAYMAASNPKPPEDETDIDFDATVLRGEMV
jgi:hypothetical protein